jgi:hypothetical protein
MSLRITIDIFSGRPNPVMDVTGREAHEILERVKPSERLRPGHMGAPEHILGYRGLSIEQVGATRRSGLPKIFRVAAGSIYGPKLSHAIADPNFERDFSSARGLAARFKGISGFPAILRREIDRLHDIRKHHKDYHHRWPGKERCRCAPLYEPTWWNDAGQKQIHNNCYNYATNYRTDTFAQPGRGNGAMYTSFTCASVRPAAVADDLIAAPGANNKCPEEGHLVALVIWPSVDFHWYRKGRNGFWSHKPGGTPVRNVDNGNHLIRDPRTADRGGYTVFCTFMVVMHGHVKIN